MISTIAGFQEQDRAASDPSNFIFSTDPDDTNDTDQTIKGQWDSYITRRGDLDQQIAACRVTRECHPRFMAWIDLIDTLKGVDDPLLVLRTVNGWVNTMFDYDTVRFNYLSQPHTKDDLWKTPKDFFISGKGFCREQAILKYETLRRLGFPIKNMLLVAVEMHNTTDGSEEDLGHMVLVVNAKGENWILNNMQRGGLDGSYIPDPEARAYSALIESKGIHKGAKM
jgi:predicted transglutaminase-like cysteine proteinase